MNWKEQIDNETFLVDTSIGAVGVINAAKAKRFTLQALEKLIADIPDDIHDAALGTRVGYNATKQLKQQLRDKWL
jgi:hypothetical protein